MIETFFKFRRKLRTASGRRTLAERALAAALVSALLLIPSTCAQVMGPHSIFSDPTGGDIHHHGGSHDKADTYGTVADLEWHVISGDGSPGWVLADPDSPEDDCPTKPRLRDLPSTMAMGAISAPATLSDDIRLELPSAHAPAEAGTQPLRSAFHLVESPPPR